MSTNGSRHVPSFGEGLRVGHLNIYHLANKVSDLGVFLNQRTPFHVFGVSESRLKPIVSDGTLSIPNFSLFRRDASCPLHTGLAVSVHDSVRHCVRRRTDLEATQVECLWLEVKTGKSPPALLGYIYRNPAASWEWYDDFVAMMDRAGQDKADVFLLGDFNIDLSKNKHAAWSSTT